MIKFNFKDSKTDGYKIIKTNALVNDKKDMIEFYSGDFMISRYYVETFKEVESGLCLEGSDRRYDITAEDVQKVKELI